MRKKLPKAIHQTIDDLRRSRPSTRDETKSTRVSLASIPSPVPSGRTGDALADEVRQRLQTSNRAGVKRPEKLALVSAAKAKSAADGENKPQKPNISE